MNLILGSGLSGLSSSYHMGHENCLVLEKKHHCGGLVHSEVRNGYTWDNGPHASFTKSEYVKSLFAESVAGEFEEFEIKAGNYYHGSWIAHPAQTSLHQVPQPLRDECLNAFLESRNQEPPAVPPGNYGDWLDLAFGRIFAAEFAGNYTRKYWTRDPSDLTTEWIGNRVYLPSVEDVVQGSKGPLDRSTHYVTKVRYPSHGGYFSFSKKLSAGSNIRYGSEVCEIDLEKKQVWTTDGSVFAYDRLVNTLPLPVFVHACRQADENIREAARRLECSQALLINISAPCGTKRPENWVYVYDVDKLSTRLYCTEKMSPGNAPAGHTGVQVEVYYSRHRPLKESPESITRRVIDELLAMGIIEGDGVEAFSHHLPWANVIFDRDTKGALDTIWAGLEPFGLQREEDDLHPLTDWPAKRPEAAAGPVVMAGRFGQWKYYWSDDCVLRGQLIAGRQAP